jgi:hypothetical protein
MAGFELQRDSKGGNRKGGEMEKSIVCGLDGSPDSEAALAVAGTLAKRFEARLVWRMWSSMCRRGRPRLVRLADTLSHERLTQICIGRRFRRARSCSRKWPSG